MVGTCSIPNISNHHRHYYFELTAANLGTENLGVEFRSHSQGCGSGSQPAARALFTFGVAFLSLPIRVSLAGAGDGGGTGGTVEDNFG